MKRLLLGMIARAYYEFTSLFFLRIWLAATNNSY